MISDDTPITRVEDDLYGHDRLAAVVAKAIERNKSPNGLVLGISGNWGSGKSSLANLIELHLGAAVANDELTTLRFNPWWLRAKDDLTLAFLQELYAGFGPHVSERLKGALVDFGKRLLNSSAIASPVVSVVTGAVSDVTAGVIQAVGSTLADRIRADEPLESLFRKVADALKAQEKRYLVVIDDLDRLEAEELLAALRLVKSVGRLPKVTYLLLYDSAHAEAALSGLGLDGKAYLEKIVQATFDIPYPDLDVLHAVFRGQLAALVGKTPTGDEGVRFENVMNDAVLPNLRTPRDLVRLISNLSLTYPAVEGEVDKADFVGIEALRLFRPDVHHRVQTHKAELCGSNSHLGRSSRQDEGARYDGMLFGDTVDVTAREGLRTALRRLFPRLDAVWGNFHHGSSLELQLRGSRSVASSEHFRTYFQFSLGDDVLSGSELRRLLEQIGDPEFVKSFLKSRLKEVRPDGSTRVAVALEDLQASASRIEPNKIAPFLSALFAVADELHVPQDRARGMWETADNQLRIHWLLNPLLKERLSLAERDQVLRDAMQNASLGWLVDLARRLDAEHHPRSGSQPTRAEDKLSTEPTADAIKQEALRRLRQAAEDGSLARQLDLFALLYRWRDFAGGFEEPKAWINSRLDDDDFVLTLAEKMTRLTWSSSFGGPGLGDTVSRGQWHADPETHRPLFDVERFLGRLAALEAQGLDQERLAVVARFREGVRHARDDRGHRGHQPTDADVAGADDPDEDDDAHASNGP